MYVVGTQGDVSIESPQHGALLCATKDIVEEKPVNSSVYSPLFVYIIYTL